MSVWKQKAEQRAAAEAVHAAVARAAAARAAAAAEAAKTPEQKAKEAEAAALERHYRAMCDATAEHGLSPGQRRGMESLKRRAQRPRDDLKLDLSKDFPALGK